MGHAFKRARDAGYKFYPYEYQHHPFGLHGHWREYERQRQVGVQHRESDLDAVDRAGSSEGRGAKDIHDGLGGSQCGVIHYLKILHAEMERQRHKTAHEIEQDKFLSPYLPLQDHTEHQQTPHIEEHVGEIAVDEHIGQHLPRTEERRSGEKHREILEHHLVVDHHCDIEQEVDQQQMLCRRRNHREE